MAASFISRATRLLLAAGMLLAGRPSAGVASASTADLVVPIVLSSGGAAGAFYTTELTLTNRGTTPATVEVKYTAAFGGGDGTCTETVLPGEQQVIPDAIAYLVGRGLPLPPEGGRGGTLRVSFSGLSSPDAAAVTARTTTATRAPQPVGAAGLAYAAVSAASGTATSATLYGLRASAQDRSNVAVFNPTPDAVTVRVAVFSGDGSGTSASKAEALEIPGLGWVQYSNVFDGTGIANGWVTVEKVGGAGTFGAYGVVNCNGTNDGSYVTPTAPGAAGSRVTVPVLVETTSGFVSELVLSNRGASEATLILRYVESLSPELGTGGTITLEIGPKTQLIVPDALEYLRGKGVSVGPKGAAHYAGALRISAEGAALADVFAGARTAAVSAAGGQFGLFTPGVYEGHEAATEAWLYGLRADETNRTNVAVLNSGADGAGAVTLELQAYDGDAGGVPRGDPEQVTLEPGGWDQKASFLGNKGVRNGWVRVKRLSGTAPWVAYAVVNDGARTGERTGDGAYVAMSVSESEGPSVWELSVLPSVRAFYNSLAYDPEGRPAVAFSVVSGNPEARLARWDPVTSVWRVEYLDYGGVGIDLAFDPADGNPSVSYGAANLKFAHWTGSSWKIETVDGSIAEPGITSLKYAPNGKPSVAYWERTAGLRFARWNGTTWVVQEVDPAGGSYLSLAYDSDGSPAIAYSADKVIRLARLKGDQWQRETVESGPASAVTYGRYVALAFDPTGRPAVVHGSPGAGVRFLRWDGTTWALEQVSAAGSGTSLVFDASGTSHVGFRESPGGLKVATRGKDGVWRIETVDSAECQHETSLALDPSGRPAITYNRSIGDSWTIGFAHRVTP